MAKENTNPSGQDGSSKTLELPALPRVVAVPMPEKKSDEKSKKKDKKEKKKEKGKDKHKLKLKNKVYNKELGRMQVELVKLQEWIKNKGLKVVVILKAGMRRAEAG